MYIKPIRKWLRRNPIKAVLIAILAFLLIQLPPWVADVWSLASERPLITVLGEQLHGFQVSGFSVSWVTTPLGLAALFTIIVLLLTGGRETQRETPSSTLADVEQLDARIKELERALEEGAKNYKSQLNQKEDVLKHLHSVESELGTLKTQYKWLYELADNDKKFIDRYVKVERCEIFGHDLRRELYVDFKFTILNTSVYAIAIDSGSMKGDIRFNSRLLSKGNKMIENVARYCGHGESKHFIVRQWLDRDEVADILNAPDDTDEFRFTGLDLTIKGSSAELEVVDKRLDIYGLCLTSKPLRDLYQKLDINIISASFNGFYPGGKIADRGLRININVSVTNPRPVGVMLRRFKLETKLNGADYVAHAKEGEIREGEKFEWDSVKVVSEGRRLENLIPSRNSPIILEPKKNCAGWLQFDIPDADFHEPNELPATLVVIDTQGEEHSMKCTLTYNRES